MACLMALRYAALRCAAVQDCVYEIITGQLTKIPRLFNQHCTRLSRVRQ